MSLGAGWGGAPLGSIIVKVIQKAVKEREKKVVSKLLKCELGHTHRHVTVLPWKRDSNSIIAGLRAATEIMVSGVHKSTSCRLT